MSLGPMFLNKRCGAYSPLFKREKYVRWMEGSMNNNRVRRLLKKATFLGKNSRHSGSVL
jgi:hypothetical protein